MSHDTGYDWLVGIEFGRVTDGLPDSCRDHRGDGFAFLLAPEDEGRPIGFVIDEFSTFDPDAVPDIWKPPHFEAPQLALPPTCAGEIVLAARSFYGTTPSLHRVFFEASIDMDGEDALTSWTSVLHTGDSMAHFALGYTHFELGNFHDAYRHLRYYKGIAPAQPWTHCWFGKAADALGEIDEAIEAYRHAIELTDSGAEETEAPQLLEELLQRASSRP